MLRIVKIGILANYDNIGIGEGFVKSLVKIGKIGGVGKACPPCRFCCNWLLLPALGKELKLRTGNTQYPVIRALPFILIFFNFLALRMKNGKFCLVS